MRPSPVTAGHTLTKVIFSRNTCIKVAKICKEKHLLAHSPCRARRLVRLEMDQRRLPTGFGGSTISLQLVARVIRQS